MELPVATTENCSSINLASTTSTESNCYEEDVMSILAQLSSSQVNMVQETSNLQSSIGDLLSKFVNREALLFKTVNSLQDHCVQQLKKAQEEANEIQTTATAEAATIVATAINNADLLVSKAKLETEAWETEKLKLSVIKSFENKIKLDVGGNKFTTSLTTLRRFPDSMIGAMFSGRHALTLDEEGYFFIDRDGTHFRLILNFLRSPEAFELDLTGSALKEFITECDYYGLHESMFPPIARIPPFKCSTHYGKEVLVSQDERGVWRATESNYTIRLCRHCFTAHYTEISGGGWMQQPRREWHEGIGVFKQLVEAKGGDFNFSLQPNPLRCSSCNKSPEDVAK